MSTFNELIDFTRSTTGTYLDSVVYGDESLTGSWTTVTGFDNITSGTGTNVTTTSTSSDASRCYLQINNVEQGKQYKLTVTVSQSNVSSLSVYLRDGASPNSGTLVSGQSGMQQGNTYTLMGVAESNLMGVLFIGTAASFTANVSVKEIIGGQVSGTPLLRTAALNGPRLEYDASGNPLGLLIEEARTNLLTNSNVPPSGGGAVLVKNAIAPNGAQDAWTMTYSSGVGYNAPSGASFISGTAYTFSFYFKRGTGTQQIWTLLYGAVFNNNGGNVVAIYDIESETATINVSGATANVQDVGNGWYRCSCSAIATASSTSGQQIYRQGATEAGKYDYVYGFQVETGAFPTSYIPTSGSAVTRAKDVASLPVERFAYNQPQGTVVAFQETFGTAGNLVPWEIHTANTNRIVYNAKSSTATIITGGSVQASLNHADQLPSVFYKQGLAFKKDDIASSLDASTLTDTSGTIPTVSSFKIGTDYSLLSMLNGHIKHIQYYPKRLSNEELELLTQPSASPTMNLTFDGQATSTLVEGLHD